MNVPPATVPVAIVEFVVYGPPVAWARTRTNGARHFKQDGQEEREMAVMMGFADATGGEWEPHVGPVELDVIATLLAPRQFWGQRCTKKPDYDNIGKIISDALNGLAYRDDALIDDGRVRKRYGPVEQTLITLRFYEHEPKPKKARTKKHD